MCSATAGANLTAVAGPLQSYTTAVLHLLFDAIQSQLFHGFFAVRKRTGTFRATCLALRLSLAYAVSTIK